MSGCIFHGLTVGAVMLNYWQISVWLRPALCSQMARIWVFFVWCFSLIRCVMLLGLADNPCVISSVGTC